jgi:hypothetical protein
MDDSLYQNWQESLMSLDFDITYKAHPKNRISVDLSNKKSERKNLIEVVEDFEFLFIDYLSTATAISISTDIPIIYFDLGLRNFNKKSLDALKKRCFYYKVDHSKNYDDQIADSIQSFNRLKLNQTNDYTQNYSYNKSSVTDHDIIIKVLDSY